MKFRGGGDRHKRGSATSEVFPTLDHSVLRWLVIRELLGPDVIAETDVVPLDAAAGSALKGLRRAGLSSSDVGLSGLAAAWSIHWAELLHGILRRPISPELFEPGTGLQLMVESLLLEIVGIGSDSRGPIAAGTWQLIEATMPRLTAFMPSDTGGELFRRAMDRCAFEVVAVPLRGRSFVWRDPMRLLITVDGCSQTTVVDQALNARPSYDLREVDRG